MAKMVHQWAPARSIVLSGHLSAVTNGNFRSYGGITAASHGVSQDRDDWALSATETDVWGRGWVNEARGQLARHRQQTFALDPRCEGFCGGESDGGPEIIIPGVAILGRNIYEPTARDNWRVQLSNIVSRASDPTCSRQAHRSPTSISGRARRSSSAVRSRSRRCRQSPACCRPASPPSTRSPWDSRRSMFKDSATVPALLRIKS